MPTELLWEGSSGLGLDSGNTCKVFLHAWAEVLLLKKTHTLQVVALIWINFLLLIGRQNTFTSGRFSLFSCNFGELMHILFKPYCLQVVRRSEGSQLTHPVLHSYNMALTTCRAPSQISCTPPTAQQGGRTAKQRSWEQATPAKTATSFAYRPLPSYPRKLARLITLVDHTQPMGKDPLPWKNELNYETLFLVKSCQAWKIMLHNLAFIELLCSQLYWFRMQPLHPVSRLLLEGKCTAVGGKMQNSPNPSLLVRGLPKYGYCFNHRKIRAFVTILPISLPSPLFMNDGSMDISQNPAFTRTKAGGILMNL